MMFHRFSGGGPLGHGHHWLGALFLLLLAVVVLGALAWAIVTICRQKDHVTKAGAPAGSVSGARQILDERFARGEIEPDDYKARRDLLGDE